MKEVHSIISMVGARLRCMRPPSGDALGYSGVSDGQERRNLQRSCDDDVKGPKMKIYYLERTHDIVHQNDEDEGVLILFDPNFYKSGEI